MKNWKVVILLTITLLWGCKEESVLDPIVIDDPVPEIEKFTLTASADKGVVLDPSGVYTLSSGDSMTFSFSIMPDKFIKSIRVNNNLVNPYTNKIYTMIDENTILLRARENTTLRIESILKDSIYITSGGSWYVNSIFQKNSSLEYTDWTPMTSEPRRYTDHKIFDLNGYFTVLDKNGDLCGGPYEWSINKKTLVLSYNDFTLIKVSQDTLIYDQIIGLITYREICTHKMKVI